VAGDTWRNLRTELNKLELVTYDLPDGRVAQPTPTTAGQRTHPGAFRPATAAPLLRVPPHERLTPRALAPPP